LTTLEILQEARRLLAIPNGWHGFVRGGGCGVAYRNAKSEPCEVDDAVSLSILGAFDYQWEARAPFCGRDDVWAAFDVLDDLPELDIWSVKRWNDEPKRTQEEVLDLFDRAIAKESEY